MATFETLTPDSTVDVVGGTPTTGDGSPGVKLMINRPHHRFGIWLDKKNATALAYEVYRIAHLDTGLVDIDAERRAAVRERDEAAAQQDHWRQIAKQMAKERDEALAKLHGPDGPHAKLGAALAERDEALAQRDEAQERLQIALGTATGADNAARKMQQERDEAQATLKAVQDTSRTIAKERDEALSRWRDMRRQRDEAQAKLNMGQQKACEGALTPPILNLLRAAVVLLEMDQPKAAKLVLEATISRHA